LLLAQQHSKGANVDLEHLRVNSPSSYCVEVAF
jgi:hypothetical protein